MKSQNLVTNIDQEEKYSADKKKYIKKKFKYPQETVDVVILFIGKFINLNTNILELRYVIQIFQN